jgi:hypothetical protein
MYVGGLTVSGEDRYYETDLQEFDGDPDRRIKRQTEKHKEEKLRKALLEYQKFVGPETKSYSHLQLGAMAAYYVSRGIEDREAQARISKEITNNSLSVVIVNNCIELTLETSEHLTIAALQNRGIRLQESEEINGIFDPVYEGIVTPEVDPKEYINNLRNIGAKVLELTPRDQEFDCSYLGAVTGS